MPKNINLVISESLSNEIIRKCWDLRDVISVLFILFSLKKKRKNISSCSPGEFAVHLDRDTLVLHRKPLLQYTKRRFYPVVDVFCFILLLSGVDALCRFTYQTASPHCLAVHDRTKLRASSASSGFWWTVIPAENASTTATADYLHRAQVLHRKPRKRCKL